MNDPQTYQRKQREQIYRGKYHHKPYQKSYSRTGEGGIKPIEPLGWHAVFRIRLLVCIILAGFFAVPGRMILSESARSTIHEKIEEPMSRQSLEAWAQDINGQIRKITEEIR
ncbi:MAG: hypothetical protein IJ137_06270 [Eubacterium sp.]|nr:hypothetical protein [Eubacterium sp.]